MIRYFGVIVAALALWPLARLSADETVTLDFPLDSSKIRSSQLTFPPRQLVRADGIGYTEIYLASAPGGESLLVTVVFEESLEDNPALFWADDAGAQKTLSSNLSEGVIGLNQRSVLVPAEMVASAGRLVISGNQKGIRRVQLEWVSAKMTLISSEQPLPAYVNGDRILQAEEVTGEKLLAPPDAWIGNVLEASLQEEPVVLDEGTEMVMSLDQLPEQVMLRVRVLNLPLTDGLGIEINGSSAGNLYAEVPSLSDPGYILDEEGTRYAGWRQGSLLIPVSMLQKGENSIVLKAPGTGVYVRDATLQFKVHGVSVPIDEGVTETPDIAP